MFLSLKCQCDSVLSSVGMNLSVPMQLNFFQVTHFYICVCSVGV